MPARRVTINGRDVIDPRHTRAWRTLRDQVVREEPLCQLRLPRCTGTSTTADHLVPVTVAPELALERANLQGACRQCNDDRGNLPLEALNRDAPRADVKPSALSIFTAPHKNPAPRN